MPPVGRPGVKFLREVEPVSGIAGPVYSLQQRMQREEVRAALPGLRCPRVPRRADLAAILARELYDFLTGAGGTLPQRVDRILVGDIERTRLTQIRHLFIAGVNEGNIPRSASRGGILSDMDREFLAAGGAVLAPTPRQQMFTQRLYLYLNMTKPSRTLTVSYSTVSRDGKSLRPSYLISMLRGLFPALETEYPEQEPIRGRITGRADGLSLLADQLRIFVEGNPADPGAFARDFSLLYGFYTSPEVMADTQSFA